MIKPKRIRDYYDEKTLHWFDMLLEGILILDENMIIEYVNPAYMSYSHLRKEDLIGKNMSKIRAGSVTPQVYATKSPIYNRHRIPGDGNESYSDIIPVIEADTVIGALLVVRDIRVLKNLFLRLNEKDAHISQLTQAIKDAYQVRYSFDDLIGADLPYCELARRAAHTDSSILLVGESGTGKEVMAQAIHAASSRCNQPFIDINCAALPEPLLESELFGYVPGAFTGASKNGKIGLFELANGGTIFLDEVTEMPPALQSKLLRVLQEKQVRRLGGDKNINLNARIIAATNQNIDQAVQEHRFRGDLFYRLAVVIIQIPPLRERIGSFGEYISAFIKPYEQKYQRKYHFSVDALKLLQQYEWPGNIRQLQNAIEYICMVATDGFVSVGSLPYYLLNALPQPPRQGRSYARANETLADSLHRMEKGILTEMLERFGQTTDSKKEISKALGVSLSTLYSKLNRYGLLSEEHSPF